MTFLDTLCFDVCLNKYQYFGSWHHRRGIKKKDQLYVTMRFGIYLIAYQTNTVVQKNAKFNKLQNIIYMGTRTMRYTQWPCLLTGAAVEKGMAFLA